MDNNEEQSEDLQSAKEITVPHQLDAEPFVD